MLKVHFLIQTESSHSYVTCIITRLYLRNKYVHLCVDLEIYTWDEIGIVS